MFSVHYRKSKKKKKKKVVIFVQILNERTNKPGKLTALAGFYIYIFETTTFGTKPSFLWPEMCAYSTTFNKLT